jgi:hypothetical protein
MNSNIRKPASSLLLACTLFASLLFSGAPAASAGFSIVPSNPAERQFSLEIAPGEEKQASVVIENLSDGPITLRLYGADGTLSNQGTFALTTLSTTQQHIGKWVNFKEPTLKLEARQHKEIGFTVTVPTSATPGIYSGGIAAESGGAQTVTAQAANATAQSGAISISSRIVVKIFVSVPGKKINNYEWTGFSYESPANGGNGNGNGKTPLENKSAAPPPPNGKPGTFKLHYKNTGNTVIVVDQEIGISGFPMQSDTIKMPSATLLQGSEIEIPAKWENEPFFGFYTAKASATFSEYDIVSNTKKDSRTETREISVYVPLKANTTPGKIVLALLGLLLLVIIILAVTIIRKYLLKRRCSPYVVQTGDTITSIAEMCKINWKRLAKLNKLKAPYTIKAGQKILALLQKTKPAPKDDQPKK